MRRHRIVITGIVQGVGFRPFVFQLARRLGLNGWVRNDGHGVTVEAEGKGADLAAFAAALRSEAPPLAAVTRLMVTDIPPEGETGFAILPSRNGAERVAGIPADTAPCADCLAELYAPADRRFRYPFINCTNCGPRYTIVTGLPYDRARTTMAGFAMCPACQAEYLDPTSRRFHAQPNACPRCGPRLWLRDCRGAQLPGEPLAECRRRLRAGEIVAVKGLGGYQLLVDAANPAAVERLRRRKGREEKPFAVLAADRAAVSRMASCSAEEARLLEGPERPIVLLDKRADLPLAAGVAPGNRSLGVMLPATPLHHLLIEGFTALVATSGNRHDEPIACSDDEAFERLAGITDAWLGHDRTIHRRADDSVARVLDGRALLLRRARGYVPHGIPLGEALPPVLAVGGELKGTVCLLRGESGYLSPHLGDLHGSEAIDGFVTAIGQLVELLGTAPEAVAHDLHPDFVTTRHALEKVGLPAVAVQHHHAHLAACLAENRHGGPAIGVIFDGFGLGDDGTPWGGEFLVGDRDGYRRAGHFLPVPVPGGDLAARQPWRMALSYLHMLGNQAGADLPCCAAVPPTELALVSQALQRGINSPAASSCGRLFDAVSALLGIRGVASFEGQAAMELEQCADPQARQAYPYRLDTGGEQVIFDPRPLVAALLEARAAGEDVAVSAGRFHFTLAEMVAAVCRELRRRRGIAAVALSGGVFQNALLTGQVRGLLRDAGFTVLTHALVPPNDGGLAFGQAVVAARRLQREKYFKTGC